MKNFKSRNRGFIRSIVAIAIVLIVLKYWFDIDLLNILRHPKVDPYFQGFYAWVIGVWNAYLLPAIYWLWARLQDLWELAKTLTEMLMGLISNSYDKAKVFNE